VRFRVRSSAGTYVRSLAHDLGVAAGVPAHLKELRRTAIGNFHVSDSLPPEMLENAPIEQILFSAERYRASASSISDDRRLVCASGGGAIRQGMIVTGCATLISSRSQCARSSWTTTNSATR